jgi:hypothetical protein
MKAICKAEYLVRRRRRFTQQSQADELPKTITVVTNDRVVEGVSFYCFLN